MGLEGGCGMVGGVGGVVWCLIFCCSILVWVFVFIGVGVMGCGFFMVCCLYDKVFILNIMVVVRKNVFMFVGFFLSY